MVNFSPTKVELERNNSFKILDEPKVVFTNEEMQVNMVRYLVMPLKSGDHEIPKCVIYNGKQKFISEDFVLEVSNDVLDSAASKSLLNSYLKESAKKEIKPINIEAAFDKRECQRNDTLQVTFTSAEYDFANQQIFDLSHFNIIKGPVFNFRAEATSEGITKTNKMKYFLTPKNKGELIIPSIDTLVGGDTIHSNEVKIKVK